jgi:PEP-CTERM motif
MRGFKRYVVAAAFLCAGTAWAGTLAYDGFAYAPGILPGNNGGQGFLSPWAGDPNVIVQPPGLSHPLGLPSTGLEIGGSFTDFRQLAAPLNQSEFWASFEINSNPGNDEVWLGLDPAGGTSIPFIAFGRRLDTYFIQNAGNSAATGGVASPPGVTDLLVARFMQVGAFTEVDLWVNTNNFLGLPLVSTTVPIVPYNWVNIQVQPGLFADEIRIGTSADFVAAAGAAVPEPGTWVQLLIGLLGLGWALQRRTRRPGACPRDSLRIPAS